MKHSIKHLVFLESNKDSVFITPETHDGDASPPYDYRYITLIGMDDAHKNFYQTVDLYTHSDLTEGYDVYNGCWSYAELKDLELLPKSNAKKVRKILLAVNNIRKLL